MFRFIFAKVCNRGENFIFLDKYISMFHVPLGMATIKDVSKLFTNINQVMPWNLTTRIRKNYFPHNEQIPVEKSPKGRRASYFALDDFRQIKEITNHALPPNAYLVTSEGERFIHIQDYWAAHNHLLFARAPMFSVFAGLSYHGNEEFAQLDMRLLGATREIFLDVAEVIESASYVHFPGKDGYSMEGGVDLVERFKLEDHPRSRKLLEHVLRDSDLLIQADLAGVNKLVSPEVFER